MTVIIIKMDVRLNPLTEFITGLEQPDTALALTYFSPTDLSQATDANTYNLWLVNVVL